MNCSPVSNAIANGHLAIVQWLHSVKHERCSSEVINTAASSGHLEVLQWLDASHLFRCTVAEMDGAAENGHLAVVKWLHQAHHECCSSLALDRAVKSGNLELVEWLYENVHMKCYSAYLNVYLDTRIAACRGHLDVLKWTHEHFPGSFDSHEMDAAAKYGQMDVITWLHKNRSEGCTAFAPYIAALKGHLEVLKWLYTHYPSAFEPGVSDTINRAAENGHLEVVRWLHENRPELGANNAMDNAATRGHLDIFLYLLEHRTEGFPAYTQYNARFIGVKCRFASNVQGNGQSNRVTSDQLKLLKAAFERRPAFLRHCLQCLAHVACTRGNTAILDWVNQFGIELKSTEPIRSAVGRGDVKMVQWFFENGFEVTDPYLLEVAVQRGQVEVVRWLSEHGYAVNSLELIKMAEKKYKNVPMTRWLVENGPPLDLSTASMLVMEYRHIEIAWWVTESDRVQLVLDAVRGNDREVVWWILAHTPFQDESARWSIRNAIRVCLKDTQQWLEESLSDVETCRWCFSGSSKRQNEETGETGLPSRGEDVAMNGLEDDGLYAIGTS